MADVNRKSSLALASNSTGTTIVGSSQVSGNSNGYVATIYNVDSGGAVTPTALALLGGTASQASAINGAGQVVGTSNLSGDIIQHGFIYTPTYGVQDLNTIVGSNPSILNIVIIGIGNSINDWGQIVAGGNVVGKQHAVLLNPVAPLTSSSATVRAAATQDSKIVGGKNYALIPNLTNAQAGSRGTTLALLDGTAGSGTPGAYGLNRDLQAAFVDPSNIAPVGSLLASDRVKVSGLGNDRFVLKLTYDETLANTLFGGEANARLNWLDGTGHYLNAIAGNDSGLGLFVAGGYDPNADLHLGYYGVDTTNNYVWAVLDYTTVAGSNFAVSNVDIVPEPGTWELLGLAALGGLVCRKSARRKAA